jgi:hypothetical protein
MICDFTQEAETDKPVQQQHEDTQAVTTITGDLAG